MHNPRFAFYSPETASEACAILAGKKGKAVPIAGGTDLMPRLKQRLVVPEVVVSLDRLQGLNFIKKEDNALEIGALTPLKEVEKSALVKETFPALSKAARLIAGPVHRSMGTVGGNICLENRCWYYNQSSGWRKSVEPCLKTGGTACHVAKAGKRCYAVYSADLAPVLLALAAEFVVTGEHGERLIPAGEFFADNGLKANMLAAGELLTRIRIPVPEGKFVVEYIKMRPRESVDFPLVGAAAFVRDNGAGIDVTLAFTGVASCPFQVDAGSFLKPLEKEQIFDQVGKLANDFVRPVSRAGGSPAYKKRLARVAAVDGVTACLDALGI
jgi:4-hydroxybenzoyl-CoA reductase subunit beta